MRTGAPAATGLFIRRSRVKRLLGRLATLAGLLAFVTWSLFPIYWMLMTSFKPDREIYGIPPTFIPQVWTFNHYENVLFKGHFPSFVRNSFIVATVVTLLSMVTCTLAAYALTRLRFPGRTLIARSIVVTYLLPPSLLFIPLFIVVQRLGLVDTLLALMLTYLTFTVPFCTWMLIGYFRTIPRELDEAALIDGCSRAGALFRVVLPLSLPGLSVVALFAFTQSWNEFLYSLIFVHSNSTKTITAGLAGLIMGDVFLWGQLMAASTLAVIPVLVIYVIAQRFVVEGLTVGGVKQ